MTAERHGHATAPLFWPGSEAEIDGIRPTHWLPYDGRMSHAARVQWVLDLLDLPEAVRPVFCTLYFAETDDVGHVAGPDSDEILTAIASVDEAVGLLIAGLEIRDLLDRTNVVVVSDHGMISTSRKRVVFLDDYVDLAVANPAEVRVRSEIRRAVADELARGSGRLLGLAGGANGGDILFHEVCAEIGIATELFLAIPQEEYITHSVQAEDPSWVARFRRLTARVPTRVLAPSAALPPWLRDQPGASIWQRANLWLLFHALHCTDAPVTLLALWNGEQGNGAGGTSDFLGVAREMDVRTVVLDTRRIVLGGDSADT